MRGLIAGLTNDLPLKAIALAASVALWTGVTFLGSRTVTMDDVPVSVVNLPDDLGLAEELPPVAVRVRIPRARTPDDPARLVRAFVDLEGSGLGSRTVPVTVTPAEPRVSVVSVMPASLRVTLDPLVERELPVRVVPEGSPAEEFRIGEVRAEPETVRVRGALGIFQRVAGIDASISVEGAISTVEGDAPLAFPSGIQGTVNRVHVVIEIEQSRETRNVGIRVVTDGSPADGYVIRTIRTDPATVVIRGAREAVENLTVLETHRVSVAGVQESFDQDATLLLPDGVETVAARDTVRVSVDVATLEGTTEVPASVSVTDVPEGARVESVSPATLRVTLRGSGEAFERIRDEDVRVVVSAAGRETGTFTVRPSLNDVRAPAAARAVSVEQKDVEVRLEPS